MKQLYLCLTLLLLTAISAFAQKDFRKGYIIQNGDTLHGYVDYRGDTRSAQVTAFKSTPGSQEQTFTPDAIAGYGFDAEQKVYKSKVVPPTKPDTAFIPMFLHVLAEGKASVYFRLDAEQREHFYLSMRGGALVELLQAEYVQKDAATGKTYNVTSRIFAGTLQNAFSDCSGMTDALLQKVRLTRNALTDVAQKYNQCTDPNSVTHEQQRNRVRVTVSPVVSLYHSSLKFSSQNYLGRSSFKGNSVDFGGGVALNAALPNMNEKLSFQLELLYTHSEHAAYLEETENYKGTTTYDAAFDLAYLKLPLQLRYTYPRGNIKPFFNAGILVGYAIKGDNRVEKAQFLGAGVYPNTRTYPAIPGNDNADGFRNFMEGITAGAGAIYPLYNGNLSVEARYELNNGVSAIEGIKSTMSTLYMLVGYSF